MTQRESENIDILAYAWIVNGGVIGLGMALSLLISQTKSEEGVGIYIEDLKRLENAIEELMCVQYENPLFLRATYCVFRIA